MSTHFCHGCCSLFWLALYLLILSEMRSELGTANNQTIPSSVCRSFPVAISKILIMPSIAPLAKYFPSGLCNKTQKVWFNICMYLCCVSPDSPLATFHKQWSMQDTWAPKTLKTINKIHIYYPDMQGKKSHNLYWNCGCHLVLLQR